MIPQKGLGGNIYLFQIVILLGGKIGFQGQMRHAHDGIHGSADFMAHVCQKFTLGFRGLFSSQLGLNYLGFHFFALGDVFSRIDDFRWRGAGFDGFTEDRSNH